ELEEDSMRNVFEHAADKDPKAISWLIGRKLSSKEQKELGVEFSIDNPDESTGILFDMLRVFKLANYNGIVVMFDELEYVLSSLGESKIASIIHELQSVWDDYIALDRDKRKEMARFLGVFASSPDSWQRFLELVEERQERTG